MWNVRINKKILKKYNKLSGSIQERFKALTIELRAVGPVQTRWLNYSKISGKKDCYHCHLKKGKPTYVAVWKVTDKKTIEVIYVGSHEKANYQKLC